MKSLSLALSLSVAISGAAHAELFDLGKARGESSVRHGSPYGQAESCYRIRAFPGQNKRPKDQEKEAELCNIDFYNGRTSSGKDIAICPKNYSTNPGVDIMSVPSGMTKDQYIQNECAKSERAGKKLAKFKQSISCSYTPSILGYYAFSRYLGNAGHVKQAVGRTMDLDAHREVTQQGINNTPNGDLSHTLWVQYQSWEKNPRSFTASNPSRGNALFTNDFAQIYGAIQVNPQAEEKYQGLNVKPVTRFMNTAGFQALANAKSTQGLAPSLNQATVQTITQLKDIGEMLIMDHILSQQDRYGNIHSEQVYYYLDPQGQLVDEGKKNGKASEQQSQEMSARGAALVTRMLLKDNDCGIIKDNLAKKNGLVSRIAHLSPNTYQRVLALASDLQRPEVQSWLRDDLLFTSSDISAVLTNAKDVAGILQQRCKSGALKLDLDLQYLLTHKTLSQGSCG